MRHYSLLSESGQGQLRDALRVFIAEKSWEGCGGLRLTDEIKVTIAAQACLMILGLPGYYFDKVRTILVYPSAYMVPPGARTDHSGLVHDGPLPVLGLSWGNGTVVLSWEEARQGGRNAADGRISSSTSSRTSSTCSMGRRAACRRCRIGRASDGGTW